MSQEDRIAGLIEALEIVKDVLRKYEVQSAGTVLYKQKQEAEDRANGADECRLRILTRIDAVRREATSG